MVNTYSSDNYAKHTHPNLFYQCSLLRFMQRLYSLACQAQAKSVLEVGCGEGFILDYLMKRRPNARYAGADLNREAVDMARQITSARITYICAHGGCMPFPDNSFDLVILSEVLEHIPAPEVALAEAIRLSRAHLLITVPLEPYFQSLSHLLVGLKLGHNPGHVNFWSVAGFQRWLGRFVNVVHYECCDLYQLALCRPLNQTNSALEQIPLS